MFNGKCTEMPLIPFLSCLDKIKRNSKTSILYFASCFRLVFYYRCESYRNLDTFCLTVFYSKGLCGMCYANRVFTIRGHATWLFSYSLIGEDNVDRTQSICHVPLLQLRFEMSAGCLQHRISGCKRFNTPLLPYPIILSPKNASPRVVTTN